MDFKLDLSQDNQQKGLASLMKESVRLGFKIGGYGEIAYNERSGYTYIWCEDYNFSLCISDFSEQVEVLYSDPENGEETFRDASKFKSIEEIDEWVEKIQKEEVEANVG